MIYSILRAKKLKSFGSVVRSARHTFREQLTPNADPHKHGRNRTVGAKGASRVLEAIHERLPEKRRRDAVLCIEYLITASPEAFKRHGGRLDDFGGGYFDDALAWLRKRHGVENVISSTIHMDESTPHLVAYVVPRTIDGRLCCRDFLGGPSKMREMQDSFHAACGAPRGLDRGITGSKASHDKIASFYATLASTGSAPRLRPADYAAAAIGFKTGAWKHAEEVVRSNAIQVTQQARWRKAHLARSRTLKRMTSNLSLEMEVANHRKIELEQRQTDLERSAWEIAAREREVRAAENLVSSLEVERDTLQRRLEIIVGKLSAEKLGPKHSHDYAEGMSLS